MAKPNLSQVSTQGGSSAHQNGLFSLAYANAGLLAPGIQAALGLTPTTNTDNGTTANSPGASSSNLGTNAAREEQLSTKNANKNTSGGTSTGKSNLPSLPPSTYDPPTTSTGNGTTPISNANNSVPTVANGGVTTYDTTTPSILNKGNGSGAGDATVIPSTSNKGNVAANSTGGNKDVVPETPANPSTVPETPTTPTAAPEATTPVENATVVETPAVQDPVVQAVQPTYSAADLQAMWQNKIPDVDTDALTAEWMAQVPDVDKAKSDQMALLEQWKNDLIEQNNGQIDYNVAKAITELERALEDAQPQYKEQQESIARDEMQALDNSALYAEARGDKGGIGQEQYNSIMNTAAQNRLSVQQAQTKLSTDTQRQIADLRAQGEFEKADALLEVSQQYLTQLMSLEQWAFDAGMTTAQFQASIEQWAADYKLAIAEFTTGLDQWLAGYDLDLAQYQTGVDEWNAQFQYEQTQDTLDRQATAASNLLGIGNANLTEEQLKAIGMSADQANAYAQSVNDATKAELELEWAKVNKTEDSTVATNALTDLAQNGVPVELAEGWLVASGFDTDEAKVIAKSYKTMMSMQGVDGDGGEDIATTGNDGAMTDNTVAWATKVLEANNGDMTVLEEALKNRGFSEAERLKVYKALGLIT